MKSKERIAILISNTLLSVAAIVCTAVMMKGWGVFVLILCYAVPSVCIVAGALSFALKKDVILKSVFVLSVCAFVLITVISVLSFVTDISNYKTDKEKIERLTQIIKNTGNGGMAVYVLIQILQIVILPLPAVVCYVPGSLIWGAGIATLLASVGVIIGSVMAYFIGRFFGKKAVIWIAGKETTEKYVSYIGNRGKVIFVLMQILPFFPDDVLCMIAGLTSMSFPFFLGVMIIVRPLIIAAYCYLGDGSLIPFSGWGIPVWIAIFALCIALALLSLKYQDRVEKWLISKFRKKSASGESDALPQPPPQEREEEISEDKEEDEPFDKGEE